MAGRILSIAHSESSLGWGGQEIRILTEAAGMLRRGHRLTLLCPPQSAIYQEALRRGLPVEALSIARKNLVGLLAMRTWLANNKPDIINTHSSTDTWLAALGSVGLRAKPVLVRTRHISAALSNNASTRWLYQKATRKIVTTGEALRLQLIEKNGLHEENVVSVPTGIDLEHFMPGDRARAKNILGIDENNFVIGIVATLRSWKGHRYLLQAFANLSCPCCKLLIVGDGPQRTAIEEQIQSLKIEAAVQHPGNQEDVLPWLHAMDVFVLPSYANEGVPQALMQAMACGLPCVTTPVGSILEIAKHEQTALIIPPENTHALQLALQRLIKDEALRMCIGAAARDFARQRFGVEKMLDQMEKVFENVLQKT